MVTVKNLTNSPYDLQSAAGFVRLPAFGEVTGEFTGDYLQLLEASMAVKVTDGEATKTTATEPVDELAKLRADYTEIVGKKPYHGWDAAELQAKIDEKLAE